MKIPLSWLSLYADIRPMLSEVWAKKLAHEYSIHTAEIDEIHAFGSEKRVVVGKIINTIPHPDSDHLTIVDVMLGDALGQTTIVCGAPNVLSARFVPVAIEWAVLSEDFIIKKTKIRWVESNGMICSEDELGLVDERAQGIMKLEEYFDEALLAEKLGTPFFDLPLAIPGIAFGSAHYTTVGETVFEIDNKFITNRPDLFSVRGNAREMSVLFRLPFAGIPITFSDGAKAAHVSVLTKRAIAYHLLEFNNLDIKSSPLGIRLALRKSWIQSINDIVDISNYIMTELGQPLHAFDADKVIGGIVVRQAQNWEKLLALDGKTYELTQEDIVIADDRHILAIAGIIGGADSAVTNASKRVYFESATFDALSIRLTSQRLGIRTDASQRFEKSLDLNLASEAAQRIREILHFLGKQDEPDMLFSYVDSSKIKTTRIEIAHRFIESKLGISVRLEEAVRILKGLWFGVSLIWDSYSIDVPSWRATKDVSIQEDIVEEIGRMIGYETIPETPLRGDFRIIKINHDIALRNTIIDYFTHRGFFEVYNYSFSNAEIDRIATTSMDDAIEIRNAFGPENTHLRRSLVPRLLLSAFENTKLSDHFSFFEIGKIFSKHAPRLPRIENGADPRFNEALSLAGVMVGSDIEELKCVIIGFLKTVCPGFSYIIKQGTEVTYLHPNISGQILIEDTSVPVVTYGFLHPSISQSHGQRPETTFVCFEFDFDALHKLYLEAKHVFAPISRFPWVERELNFILSSRQSTGDFARLIAETHPFISHVVVRDIFTDAAKIGEGNKSVTFSFRINNPEKTITAEEALTIQHSVIEKAKIAGFSLRSF